jgi:hypothetical protein
MHDQQGRHRKLHVTPPVHPFGSPMIPTHRDSWLCAPPSGDLPSRMKRNNLRSTPIRREPRPFGGSNPTNSREAFARISTPSEP